MTALEATRVRVRARKQLRVAPHLVIIKRTRAHTSSARARGAVGRRSTRARAAGCVAAAWSNSAPSARACERRARTRACVTPTAKRVARARKRSVCVECAGWRCASIARSVQVASFRIVAALEVFLCTNSGSRRQLTWLQRSRLTRAVTCRTAVELNCSRPSDDGHSCAQTRGNPNMQQRTAVSMAAAATAASVAARRRRVFERAGHRLGAAALTCSCAGAREVGQAQMCGRSSRTPSAALWTPRTCKRVDANRPAPSHCLH